jgi:hypothetical protein
VKHQPTSTATAILTTKPTYRSLRAQRLSERTVCVFLFWVVDIGWEDSEQNFSSHSPYHFLYFLKSRLNWMCHSLTVCTIHRPVIFVRRNGTEASSCFIADVCRPVLRCGWGTLIKPVHIRSCAVWVKKHAPFAVCVSRWVGRDWTPFCTCAMKCLKHQQIKVCLFEYSSCVTCSCKSSVVWRYWRDVSYHRCQL